jgi:exodeoxyribonuclease VII small subunit
MSTINYTAATYTELKFELEKIVRAIESNDIKIDELFPLLKQAEDLTKICEEKLRGLTAQLSADKK